VSHLRLTEIGKYQIEDVLGEGAMGVVYRALDPVLNRRVAIKIMSDALAQDTDLRQRFLREAQAAGSLQHPHVVTIYDFGDVDGHPFIAMEYVEGVDLEHLLRTNAPLPVEEKLDLVIGVLQGLAYAHKKGVIHRDIKPANVRVDNEGKARIMDFGIAHLASSNMTRTGMMLGTPNYMAPEQIIGNEVTARTDIFSVGVLLYELLTNSKPFQGDTLHAVMYKVLSEMPPPLDKVLPGLPSSLNTVVMRALQKEPSQRYSSALEMANDLTAIRSALGNRPSGTKTLSLRSTIETALAVERDARHRVERKTRYALIGAGTLVVLAIAVASFALNWRGRRPDNGDQGRPPGVDKGAAASALSQPAAGTLPASPQGVVAATDSSASARVPAATATDPARARTDSVPRTTGRAAPTARELARARFEQRAALGVRRRAEQAGATADELRVGDAHNRTAESFLRNGLLPEATDELNQASAAWEDAAAAARQRVAAASSAAARSQSTGATTSSAPRPVVSAPPLAPVPTQPVPKAAAITPPADPTAEITTLVAAYARAIEARDIAALRRLYPDMTQAQQQGFQDFFAYTRSLKASLAVSSLQVDGGSAEARLTGVYDFVTTAGRAQSQQVSFQATLRRENVGWRFVSIR
jgi:serine/threonine-protein kinase